jgi:hypothetical protein
MPQFTKRDFIQLAILFALIALVFVPIIGAQSGGEDFGGHEIFARQMEASGQLILPHFLYPVLLIGLHQVLPELALPTDALIIALLFEMLLGAVLYGIFNSRFGASVSAMQSGQRMLSILALMTVAPILVFTLFTHNLHWGYWDYLAITTYHNPTMILLRPLALLLFYLSLRAFGEKEVSMSEVIATALVVILSTLAKPNFIICLLPAVGVMIVLRLIMKRALQWKQVIFGLLAPSIMVLGWQFWFTYTHQQNDTLGESHIVLAPFAFFHWNWLGVRFLFSILFPLTVTLFYRKQALADFPIMFSWLVFLFGAFYTYFLGESGERLTHGNFVWCGQITLFILFVTAFVIFIRALHQRDEPNASRIKLYLCGSVFVLHVLSGIFWYMGHLNRQPWWN